MPFCATRYSKNHGRARPISCGPPWDVSIFELAVRMRNVDVPSAMNPSSMKKIVLFTIAFTIMAATAMITGANAQWHSDSTTNTAVCTNTALQDYPASCSDGADGVIITWEDYRSQSTFDIYAQRLNALGVPQWTANGIPICTLSSAQNYPIIAQDGNGGAYIVWEDQRNQSKGIDLYGQHVAADGSIKYAKDGIPICTFNADQKNAKIAWDEVTGSSGAAWVVWEDARNSITSSRPDIFCQRMTDAGVSFAASGMVVTQAASGQRGPRVVADGAAGCFVGWTDASTAPASIVMQRITSSGTFVWSDTLGTRIYLGDNFAKQSSNLSLTRDGNTCLAAWEETSINSGNGQNVLANRVRADGTKLWFSPADVTGDWPGGQTAPAVFNDDSVGTGLNNNAGLMVCFEDNESSTQYDVCMVRVLPDGVGVRPTVPNGFYYAVRQPLGQTDAQYVKEEAGNIMTVWEDARLSTGDSAVYGQRIDRTGKRYFNNSMGMPISSKTGRSSKHVSLVSCTNGAIATWSDNRNGNYDIFSQLVFKDGSLPIELTNFDARAIGEHVQLAWATANEKDNAGFVVERREISAKNLDNHWDFVSSFETNSELQGAMFSTARRSYNLGDDPGVGIFEYRLIDVALNGIRTAHIPHRVEVSSTGIATWSLGISRPNPFQTRTFVPFTLAANAVVDITVQDALGREVTKLAQHMQFEAGEHQIELNMGADQATGVYYVTMTAFDAATGNILFRTDKPVALQHIH